MKIERPRVRVSSCPPNLTHTHTRSHQVNQRKSELEQVLDIRHP